MAFIGDMLDRLFGRGRYSVTVPPMDGALKPNQRLESAAILFKASGVDNIVAIGEDLIYSEGAELKRRTADGEITALFRFANSITCLASNGAGLLAVGLDGLGVTVLTENDAGTFVDQGIVLDLRCPTAIHFVAENAFAVANGSAQFDMADWKRDFFARAATGSIWRFDLSEMQGKCISRGLAFPYGLVNLSDGALAVAESWRHRVLAIDPNANTPVRVLLDHLPGYPCRIARDDDGHFWLCLFSCRTQLLEFILKEKVFLRRMTSDIHPDLWISPSMSTPTSVREPMQSGRIRQMGILKPWAPSQSYGLVALCDASFNPIDSFHSRADGHVHGMTSICVNDGWVLASSRGLGGVIKVHQATRSRSEKSHATGS